jgi:hypothetical protein
MEPLAAGLGAASCWAFQAAVAAVVLAQPQQLFRFQACPALALPSNPWYRGTHSFSKLLRNQARGPRDINWVNVSIYY